jgi:hypothetical protein
MILRRRQFIALVGGAVAWPFTLRAQQPAKVPRIGYLAPGSSSAGLLARDEAFRQGLQELGYVEEGTSSSNIDTPRVGSTGYPNLLRSWSTSRST